jgi:hypothetical protein
MIVLIRVIFLMSRRKKKEINDKFYVKKVNF